MFKKLMLATTLATLALTAQAQTEQQNKMKSCNAEAKGKSGDERRAFMKQCLQGSSKEARPQQREKMKGCNAEAKGKKGDERKAFMKQCLSK